MDEGRLLLTSNNVTTSNGCKSAVNTPGRLLCAFFLSRRIFPETYHKRLQHWDPGIETLRTNSVSSFEQPDQTHKYSPSSDSPLDPALSPSFPPAAEGSATRERRDAGTKARRGDAKRQKRNTSSKRPDAVTKDAVVPNTRRHQGEVTQYKRERTQWCKTQREQLNKRAQRNRNGTMQTIVLKKFGLETRQSPHSRADSAGCVLDAAVTLPGRCSFRSRAPFILNAVNDTSGLHRSQHASESTPPADVRLLNEAFSDDGLAPTNAKTLDKTRMGSEPRLRKTRPGLGAGSSQA